MADRHRADQDHQITGLLQLRHLIDHNGLLDHLERVGQVLWERSAEEAVP